MEYLKCNGTNACRRACGSGTKTLKEMNLKFSIDEIASDDIPAGQVISQTPVGGASVKEQRIIHLTVSKGGAVIWFLI